MGGSGAVAPGRRAERRGEGGMGLKINILSEKNGLSALNKF